MEEQNYTIALLIDTDNVSSKYMGALYNELILLGKITYKRMYGDFTVPNAIGWKKIVNDFAITPVQQYTYTTGKNATDFKLIIDAMDILYTKNVDAFCIMSSDSDFTGLAKRLKESNIFVIGAGEKKTPNSFVKSCDRFFTLDKLYSEPKDEHPSKSYKKATTKETGTKDVVSKETLAVVEQEVQECITKEMLVNFSIRILEGTDGKPYALSALIAKLYQAYPQFNLKDYGAKKAQDFFSKEIFTISSGKSTEKYISLK
jgi:hypothetical protein